MSQRKYTLEEINNWQDDFDGIEPDNTRIREKLDPHDGKCETLFAEMHGQLGIFKRSIAAQCEEANKEVDNSFAQQRTIEAQVEHHNDRYKLARKILEIRALQLQILIDSQQPVASIQNDITAGAENNLETNNQKLARLESEVGSRMLDDEFKDLGKTKLEEIYKEYTASDALLTRKLPSITTEVRLTQAMIRSYNQQLEIVDHAMHCDNLADMMGHVAELMEFNDAQIDDCFKGLHEQCLLALTAKSPLEIQLQSNASRKRRMLNKVYLCEVNLNPQAMYDDLVKQTNIAIALLEQEQPYAQNDITRLVIFRLQRFINSNNQINLVGGVGNNNNNINNNIENIFDARAKYEELIIHINHVYLVLLKENHDFAKLISEHIHNTHLLSVEDAERLYQERLIVKEKIDAADLDALREVERKNYDTDMETVRRLEMKKYDIAKGECEGLEGALAERDLAEFMKKFRLQIAKQEAKYQKKLASQDPCNGLSVPDDYHFDVKYYGNLLEAMNNMVKEPENRNHWENFANLLDHNPHGKTNEGNRLRGIGMMILGAVVILSALALGAATWGVASFITGILIGIGGAAIISGAGMVAFSMQRGIDKAGTRVMNHSLFRQHKEAQAPGGAGSLRRAAAKTTTLDLLFPDILPYSMR